jgi:hypothetical protein
MRILTATAALVAVTMVGPVPDRAAVGAAVGDTTRTVAAGDTVVDGGRLAVGRTEKVLRVAHGDSVRDYGLLVQTLTRVATEEGPRLLSVQYSPRGLFPTDSSLSSARTLRPLRQHSHSSSRMMRLDFDGRRVTGSYEPADSAARRIDQAYGTAPFDANVGDLVVAALPLRIGRVFRVPTYIYERGGLVWETVAVRSRERRRVGGRAMDVFRVVGSGPGGTTTYWITADPPRRVVETVRDLGMRGRAILRLRSAGEGSSPCRRPETKK